MRHQHRARPPRTTGADPTHERSHGGSVIVRIGLLEDGAHHGWLGIGQREQRDPALVVLELERRELGLEPAHQVKPRARQQASAEAQALRAVVVAGRDHHAKPEIDREP
jgi:hypothetical protein